MRLALTTLRTAAVQLRAADESVMRAQRSSNVRDRFQAGVGDNLEVVSAQTSLANARDAQVTALAQPTLRVEPGRCAWTRGDIRW